MARHKLVTRKRDDAAWVEKVASKLIKDAGITTLAELEGRPELDDDFLPAIDLTLAEFDEDLSEFGLPGFGTASEPPCVTPRPPLACGTRRICIRVHERVLFAFKAEAAKTGTPYQTLMKRVLDEAAETLV